MASFKNEIDALPVDVWIKIFDNIAELDTDAHRYPRSSLVKTSSTCRAFRSLALPLMCRTFIYHSFIVEPTPSQQIGSQQTRLVPPLDEIDRELQRLEFFSSEPIASYVRHLELLPWKNPTTVIPETPLDNLDSMWRKFYQVLPQFRNARSFQSSHTKFDAFTLQQISRLPQLKFVGLTCCKLLSPANISLHLHGFRIQNLPSTPESIYTPTVNLWLSLLDLNQLEHLCIKLNHAYPLFLPEFSSIGKFNSLISLEISMNTGVLRDFSLLLSETPRIQSLKLGFLSRNINEWKEVIEAYELPLISPIPYLQDYWGPYELLPFLIGRSTKSQKLRRLYLESLSWPGEDFSVYLQLFSSSIYSQYLTDVTHFHVNIRSVKYSDLASLCAILTKLQSLSVEALYSTQVITPETFLDDLINIPLSPHIQSLRLNWTASASEDIDAKHRETQAKLASRFPLLKKVWLCDWRRSAFLWHRSASGRQTSMVLETRTQSNFIAAIRAHDGIFPDDFGPFARYL
ncbi:hypothetical protein GALMADRAFT_154387 [Galerina marginata CBS 339.88]|uniref:F-box domain-containing protein n=1 Tax=Galerina marginata (strain CBS 339.88) TaxID=685588 RepID=A0A067THY6_GALM3|nr:hypothetical protein GALMADRAFT_154387 [Galerina marginata CBS 339.88]